MLSRITFTIKLKIALSYIKNYFIQFYYFVDVATTSANSNKASKGETYTTETPVTATTKASATATVQPTFTTHDTTKSSSADGKITSPSVTTSSSISTTRNGKSLFVFLKAKDNRMKI